MKKVFFALLVMSSVLIGGAASAQDQFAVGGHLLLGGAGIAEDFGEDGGFIGTADVDMEFRARLAAGMGGFFNYYLTDKIALYGGLDFFGKGGKFDENGMTMKIYTRHMDIPLGAMVNIQNIHLGGALVPSFTLAGKYKSEGEVGGVDYEAESDFEDEVWDNLQRFNVGLRLFAAYAIPVGPISILPGLMYQMDLLNATKGDAKDADMRWRSINLMLTAGVEYDF